MGDSAHFTPPTGNRAKTSFAQPVRLRPPIATADNSQVRLHARGRWFDPSRAHSSSRPTGPDCRGFCTWDASRHPAGCPRRRWIPASTGAQLARIPCSGGPGSRVPWPGDGHGGAVRRVGGAPRDTLPEHLLQGRLACSRAPHVRLSGPIPERGNRVRASSALRCPQRVRLSGGRRG